MVRIIAARPRSKIKKKKNTTTVPSPLMLIAVFLRALGYPRYIVCISQRAIIPFGGRNLHGDTCTYRYLELSRDSGCWRDSCSPMLDARRGTGANAFVIRLYCSSFPARTRVGKEKSARDNIFGRVRTDREISRIFSRYRAAFRWRFPRSGRKSRSCSRIPRKTRLMIENLNHRLATLPPIMTENNGECTYLPTRLRRTHTMASHMARSCLPSALRQGKKETMEGGVGRRSHAARCTIITITCDRLPFVR